MFFFRISKMVLLKTLNFQNRLTLNWKILKISIMDYSTTNSIIKMIKIIRLKV